MCKLVVTLRRWCLVPQGGRNVSLHVAKRFCCPMAFEVVEASGWEISPNFSAGKQAGSGGFAVHVIPIASWSLSTESYTRVKPPQVLLQVLVFFPAFAPVVIGFWVKLYHWYPFWWPWPYVKVTAAGTAPEISQTVKVLFCPQVLLWLSSNSAE